MLHAGRRVTHLLVDTYAHGCHRAPLVCSTLKTSWDRFNTGRSLALIVWAGIAMAFLLPASPPLLEASNSPVNGYTETHPANHTTTAPPSGPDEVGSSSALARMPHHYTTELTLLQRHNLSACWGASAMHVMEALWVVEPMREVVVAVLDTGIDAGSPLLAESVCDRICIVDTSDDADARSHGTHVAGTIATIAPNSRIVDVRVANGRGLCTSSDVAEGIRAAVNDGATVINLSLEVEGSPELEAAVDYAWSKGAVIVAAAGMPMPESTTASASSAASTVLEGPCRPAMSPPVYPASYPEAIAVTGTNEDGELAPVCNRGTWVDVAAPGLRTFSELPGGTRGYLSGTSTAAAHVSGLAALLCGIAEDENANGSINDEVRHALETTARPTGIEGTGSGIVDAAAAVQLLQS